MWIGSDFCLTLFSGMEALMVLSAVYKLIVMNWNWLLCTFPYCHRDGYSEKCVMNNYFGIGLDAKISLEFNNKREEHPEKCR